MVALASVMYANRAQAQFAEGTDYEYTVLYEDPTISFVDYYLDLHFDFVLYIESPTIPGHWQIAGEPFDTRDEAEFWQSIFATSYNTYILAIPSTQTLPSKMNLKRTQTWSRP
ncbi:hypothetical protein RSSM_05173 [Rhodopirellula sallentina SM41]|uniref:Uncharacterized protein n=1 Tax=Rhodopirellula sallentina SM41 TaxID=1263870 RepID=M5TW39_9BACT|nr:hypothetical protein RSSM_05173 [Rhodopirellula sallentina SM41]